MSRLSIGDGITISSHGYFRRGGQTYDFELLPGVDWVSFDDDTIMDDRRVVKWDSPEMEAMIRAYLETHPVDPRDGERGERLRTVTRERGRTRPTER